MNTQLKIKNLCSISATFPELPQEYISRDSFLEMMESQLEDNKVLIIDGDEGVGLTTTLAMFAGRHNMNCVSFFCSNFSNTGLNVSKIQDSVDEQLVFFINGVEGSENTVNTYRIMRKIRQNNQKLYFVFDGFDKVPEGSKESVRNYLLQLYQIQNTRFIFTGKIEQLRQVLPPSELFISPHILVRFEEQAVLEYVKKRIPNITNEEAKYFWYISKGNAERLSSLFDIYNRKKGTDILKYDNENLYEEDIQHIENCPLEQGVLFVGLITMSEIPIHKDVVKKILGLSEEDYKGIIDYFAEYILNANEYPQIGSHCLRKYLYRSIDRQFREEIETRLIGVLETEDPKKAFSSLSLLLSETNRNRQLVEFLTSDKVLLFLEKSKSQSAINEQCDYGYVASNATKREDAFFRFAVTRSASREMEQNELSESELSALLAVGDIETAYNLSQDVFLLEERLKCLLLIAQRKDILPNDMAEDVIAQIKELAGNIKFARIPDKALGLAELMLPVDFSTALSIIDQVAKVTNNRQRIDKLYTMFSMAYNEEEGASKEDVARADIAATRIEDDRLRTLSIAMRRIMRELTVAQMLEEIEKLPSDTSKLYFLQFWIPEHKNLQNIGDAILYAVKLVIQASDMNTPKVSLLKEYCRPLSKVPEAIISEILLKLDAATEVIKYPTIDYVELQLLIVEAVSKYDKAKAFSKLQDLYLEMTEYEDKWVMIHAKSILLKNYNKLGTPEDLKNAVMPESELYQQIVEDIKAQFLCSAYHMKVVEGAIKAIICTHPAIIEDVVPFMNTEARRSRAFSLAASEYAKQVNIDVFDADRLVKYLEKVTYDRLDKDAPVKIIIRRLTSWVKDETKVLKYLKQLNNVYDMVEDDGVKCYVLSKVYLWGAKHCPDDSFFSHIKEKLDSTWKKIDIPWIKVGVGYEIARCLSKISLKQDAREYIQKTNEYRKSQVLPNDSCFHAVYSSLLLYVYSLGILIRSGICVDDDIERFKNMLAHFESDGEAMILWGYLALEYYVAGKLDKFANIVRLHIDKDISDFSLYQQKRILFHTSPALYLNASEQYYQKIATFDDSFQSECINHIANFVISHYPYISRIDSKRVQNFQRDLEYNDVSALIHLMKISQDECFVFNYIDLLTRKEKESALRKLSKEQRRDMVSSLEEMTKTKFPTVGGIQHLGYKIICEAMILGCKPYAAIEWDTIKSEIDTIDNLADRAFLYIHASDFIKHTDKRYAFMDEGLRCTLGISGGLDKLSRMEMCMYTIFPCRDKIRTRNITNQIGNAMLNNKNGTYQDYQKMIDVVYENDPELAEMMVEQLDKDTARLNFKRKIKRHIESNKKLTTARNALQKVSELNEGEQIRFYEKQLADIVAQKATIRDVTDLNPVLSSVYNGPIENMVDAIIYYMENLYQRYKKSTHNKDLLRQVHEALFSNLKLVFAVSSNTQDRMKRINDIMSRKTANGGCVVMAGQENKGYELIKEWYRNYQYEVLRIIDPYFHPCDLTIIKQLFDINSHLEVTILTNMEGKDDSIDDYQLEWNKISSDMPGKLKIVLVRYADNKLKCPIHDRWWIQFDPEEGDKKGIQAPSVSTFGVRDSAVTRISDEDLSKIDNLWITYVNDKIRKTENEERLVYEEREIR